MLLDNIWVRQQLSVKRVPCNAKQIWHQKSIKDSRNILQLVEVVVVIRPQILMVDIGGLIVAQCSIWESISSSPRRCDDVHFILVLFWYWLCFRVSNGRNQGASKKKQTTPTILLCQCWVIHDYLKGEMIAVVFRLIQKTPCEIRWFDGSDAMVGGIGWLSNCALCGCASGSGGKWN